MKIIAITICVWKRVEITRSCYKNLEDQRSKFNDFGFDFQVYICGSEDVHKILANEFGYKYVHSPNTPVGNKWEKALRFSIKDKWDYWMTLGSDDFLLDNSSEIITGQMMTKDCHSGMPKNILFFENDSGLGFEFKDVKRCGAARWYKRSVIEETYSKTKNIYPEKSKGLDHWSELSIFNATGVRPKRFGQTYVADVKSDVNINSFRSVLSFSKSKGKPHELDIADYIPEFKRKIIT